MTFAPHKSNTNTNAMIKAATSDVIVSLQCAAKELKTQLKPQIRANKRFKVQIGYGNDILAALNEDEDDGLGVETVDGSSENGLEAEYAPKKRLIKDAILRSLAYPGMETRYEVVADAHAGADRQDLPVRLDGQPVD